MKEIVALLEEPSAKEVLSVIIPKLFPDISFRCIVFDGKQDLEKNITRKLKCYQNADARFLIIRDKDSGDCKKVKQQIVEKCVESGKTFYKVRILCHELETIFLADLQAVQNGLKTKNIVSFQNKNPFRNPDDLPSPKLKLKELVSQHKGIYQDISGSRAIAPYLDLNNTRSSSFKNLVSAIKTLAE